MKYDLDKINQLADVINSISGVYFSDKQEKVDLINFFVNEIKKEIKK